MQPLQYWLQTVNTANGTGLQGYVEATYAELVTYFGKPYGPSEDGKVQHQWVINIEGVTCTIYDYKEDLNTGKPEGWHVGGRAKIAPRLVQMVLDQERGES